MTRKRFRKLGYALMQRINTAHIAIYGKGCDGWGTVLKGVQKVSFGTKQAPNCSSYAEAWESIKPIREQYGL